MNLGRVIGSVWATRKDDSITGKRILFLQPLDFTGAALGDPIAALDSVDAGVGNLVIYVSSSEAAIPFGSGLTVTDATIVGVVESVDHETGSIYTPEGGGDRAV